MVHIQELLYVTYEKEFLIQLMPVMSWLKHRCLWWLIISAHAFLRTPLVGCLGAGILYDYVPRPLSDMTLLLSWSSPVPSVYRTMSTHKTPLRSKRTNSEYQKPQRTDNQQGLQSYK